MCVMMKMVLMRSSVVVGVEAGIGGALRRGVDALAGPRLQFAAYAGDGPGELGESRRGERRTRWELGWAPRRGRRDAYATHTRLITAVDCCVLT